MKKQLLLFSLIILILPGCTNDQEKKITRKKIPATLGEDYFYKSHTFPYNKIDYEAHKNASRSIKRSIAMRTSQLTEWEFAGPVNIGGRITDIEYNPLNGQIAYLSAASGGVFKTTDGGTTWLPVFDNETTLSIGDIGISASNPDILYIGTGEANGGSGSLTYDANGVYKSTDAGTTWTNVGLQNTRMTGRMAVHPTNPDVVFAACMGDMYGATPDRGLYKSSNGGTSWTNVLFVDDSTGVADVVINPVNPSIVFATTWKRSRYPNSKDYAGEQSGVWKSTDGGDTFTRLDASNGLPPVGVEYSRIGIDLCAGTPNVVYCMYINEFYEFMGIYKSTDNGINWSQTNDAVVAAGPGGGQFYWYGRVKCDPVDPDVLYVIGFDMYKTKDGGNSYDPTFVNAHVDQHAVAIHPANNNEVLLGNDGGLYHSTDAGDSWTHNETLPISQIYRCEIDYSNPLSLYYGLQDNGTVFTATGNTNDYFEIFGGDGMQALVDPSNTGVVLAGFQFGNIWKFDGFTWNPSTSGIFGDANWNYPLTMDPVDANIVYTGTQQVYKSTDFGSTWNSISPDLTTLDITGNLTFGTITFIDVSPLNSNIIYAGTDDGKVWNTLNGGGNWTQVNNGLPLRWVTCVENDPFDAGTAYVTLSGYRFHDMSSHVYKTTDNGQTWNSIGTTLPDVPCNNIIADPTIPDLLYLATDVGVYFTDDGGGNWQPMADGMPVVVCNDMKLHQPTRTLIVGTYGRGAYKINLDNFVGIELQQKSIAGFKVFPNPVTNGHVTLSFMSNGSKDISVAIYDLSGKLILRKNENAMIGNNIISFLLTDLHSGLYVVTLEDGAEKFSSKLLIW